jgi:hypothetical protein
MERNADNHRRKARRYLERAQATADLEGRQALLKLCEQELVAAAAARQPPDDVRIERRKRPAR